MNEPPRISRVVLWLAHGFGLGLIPSAPGTWGSLWGLPLVWGIQALSPTWGCAATVVPLFLVGVWICSAGRKHFGKEDPKQVVFDEIAAFPIVFMLAPISMMTAPLGFLLFRLFDVTKPWPIRRLEMLPGGWGVMADDAGAAVIAGVLLWLISAIALPLIGWT